MRILILVAILVTTAYGADFTTYVGPGTPGLYNQSTIGALGDRFAGQYLRDGARCFRRESGPQRKDPIQNHFWRPEHLQLRIFDRCRPVGRRLGRWANGITNFPLKNPIQSLPGRQGTGFLMKLAPDGTVLYSSYFGGNSVSSVNGVATDSDGNVYVTGWTFSIDFPVTPGLPSTPVDPNRSLLRYLCCQA